MSGLLTGGIANVVNGALGGIMYSVTVARDVHAVTSPPKPWEPFVGSTISVTFKGFKSSYSASLVDGERIQKNDEQIIVLAKSASSAGFMPVPGDRVSVNGVVYSAVKVNIDPAGATITMQVRI